MFFISKYSPLRVDTAQSSIGAVLLAQLSNIDNDVKPVAFFSKTFDGYHRPQNWAKYHLNNYYLIRLFNKIMKEKYIYIKENKTYVVN